MPEYLDMLTPIQVGANLARSADAMRLGREEMVQRREASQLAAMRLMQDIEDARRLQDYRADTLKLNERQEDRMARQFAAENARAEAYSDVQKRTIALKEQEVKNTAKFHQLYSMFAPLFGPVAGARGAAAISGVMPTGFGADMIQSRDRLSSMERQDFGVNRVAKVGGRWRIGNGSSSQLAPETPRLISARNALESISKPNSFGILMADKDEIEQAQKEVNDAEAEFDKIMQDEFNRQQSGGGNSMPTAPVSPEAPTALDMSDPYSVFLNQRPK